VQVDRLACLHVERQDLRDVQTKNGVSDARSTSWTPP
jgi:hypothetical protein